MCIRDRLKTVVREVVGTETVAINRRLLKLEKAEDDRARRAKGGKPGTSGAAGKGKKKKTSTSQTSQEFLEARRLIRLSPCNATKDDVRKFLEKELKMDEDIIDSIEITQVKPFLDRKRLANKNKIKKTTITLSTIDERDAIFTYASNLTSGASMDVVIPDSLKVAAMNLEHFAYKYRQRSKESSGGDKSMEARTQIRLDTMKEGLLLGIRDTKESEWTFFKPSELPDVESSEEESTDGEGLGEDEEGEQTE